MNPRYHASLRLLTLTLGAALPTGAALAGASSTIPTYQAGAGALSYTFFNLSGNNCTLTAYGSGGNPNAYSSWAQANGWGNDSAGDAGFFNPNGLGGDNNNPSGQVTGNYLFYNNYDPLDASSIPSAAITLNNGQGQIKTVGGVLITSGELGPVSGNASINYPAMGDSWGISCSGANVPSIAVANLASAASVLQSNGPTAYPYNSSLTGWFYNAAINPPALSGCNGSQNTTYTNPCGVGFTSPNPSAGNQILNWNTATTTPTYQAMGGLWSGVNYNTSSCGSGNNTGCTASSYPATSLLNMPMLPINLSAYVTTTQGNFNPNDSSESMYYTPIYGGHFTLAMGDPFIISSYAAKILWYAATSTTLQLGDATTLSSIQSALSNTSSGVFSTNSYEDAYVQWLVGSYSSTQGYTGAPTLAAQAYQSAYKAASVPLTKESVWGKVFTGLADVAVNSLVAATAALPGGVAVAAVATGAATTAAGAVVPDMNAAIGNAFTTTISGPAPLSQTAPAVINPTYAADNLLGLMLTNTGVQYAIDTVMKFTSAPSALTSNYSIYTGNTGTACTDIQVSTSLVSGNCPDGNGGSNANNGTNPPANGYTNVYYPTGASTTQLSLWDAILTGSDVVNNGGYMELGDSAGDIPSFSPPVQMINATSGAAAPTTALPSGVTVNTSFNLNSGTLTLQSLAFPLAGGDPTTAGSTPAPAAMPSVTVAVNGSNPSGDSYSIPGSSSGYPPTYNATTGIYSIDYYWTSGGYGYYAAFANGTQTINMTGCPADANILLSITPDPSNTTGGQASGSLSCGSANDPINVQLSYQSCVSDPWATGGVLAAITSIDSSTGQGSVTLACACVPGYLDGAKTTQAGVPLLGGVVVGATSANPSQTCPAPAG